MIWAAVAVAGALGAVCRFLLDTLVSGRTNRIFGWGTFLVNVSGSLAAGVVAGLAVGAVVPSEVQVVVAGGFLGAYTTFSTAMYDSVRLFEAGAPRAAVTNLLGTLVTSVAAATVGWVLAS